MTNPRHGLLLAAVLALPAVARAQGVGMIPWWDRPIAANLGLSDDQNRQIREVVRGSRDHLIELRAAVQKAEAGLRDDMNDEKVDPQKAEAAIDKVVAARAELMRAVSQMSLKLRMVLTLQQWQELERRQQRMPGAGRRGGGMGGTERSRRPPG